MLSVIYVMIWCLRGQHTGKAQRKFVRFVRLVIVSFSLNPIEKFLVIFLVKLRVR